METSQPVNYRKNYQLVTFICLLVMIVILIATEVPKLQTGNTTPQEKTYLVEFKKGIIVSGSSEIISPLGQKVTFIVTSDIPGTFQINGYVDHINIEKNKPKKVTIFANQAGRFVFNLNNSADSFGSLDVSPN